MEIKGVFFDIYGTLLTYGDMSAAWADWLSAFYECLKGYGLKMSKESFSLHCYEFFGKPEPSSQNDSMTIFERRIQALCEDLGLELRRQEIQMTATTAANAWQRHISLDPEAIPVLKALKKTKKVLAIISNFDHPPHIYSLLSELGLRKFFSVIVISGEVGFKKPNPQIFSLTLKQTGLRENEVIYVGDTLEDAKGAHTAGICPILIQRNRPNENRINLDFRSNQQVPDSESESPSIIGSTRTISKLSELM
jgi:putative hydrolase of the HAD superfamily